MRRQYQNISNLLLCCVMSLAVMQTMAQTPQDLLNQIFSQIKNKVIDGANKLQQWKTDAEAAARKTANDFTECPSSTAQNLYNDLKQKKQQAEAVKNAAEQADRDAQSARDECKRKTHLNAQCDSSYNSLSFKATAAAAVATITSLDAAITAMQNLKCPSGCNQTGKLIYPTFNLSSQIIGRDELFRTSIGASQISIPYPTGLSDLSYCSSWSSGEFSANWNLSNGEFSEGVRLKFPSCKTVDSISCCSEWDLALVLPKLKKLDLVPPTVTVSDLTVSIPNKNVEMVTGVKTATCSRAVKVCKRSSVTIGLDVSSNPLTTTPSSCQEWVEIGCAAPAFGLEPVRATTSVPDLTKVKFSWQGLNIKGGSIEVDMTKPEFKGTCKKGCPTSFKVPVVNVEKGSLDLPWACLQPRFSNIVANQ